MKPRLSSPRSPAASRGPDLRSGASQSKTRIADKFQAYLVHHRIVAIESLLRLLKTPLQSLLTWLVVAIAIALPAVLYLGLAQFESLGEQWQAKPQLSVFIRHGAKEPAVLSLRDKIVALPGVATVHYVSPDQALMEFEQYSGLGNVLSTLDENPLPPVLMVQPAGEFAGTEQLDQLRAQLAGEALVDEVQFDRQWVQRLQQIMVIGQRVVLGLGALLALGVLLVIGNTIRLAIESRRDEIVIVKLVGGTNAFVRRPFLYTGLWYGLGGGLLALLLLLAGTWWLAGPVSQLAGLYQSDLTLQGLKWGEAASILLGSGILGLLGATLAVSKHLQSIEPN